jgi:hypothetical protein
LLPNVELSGVAAQYWETPADALGRSINEQLSTKSFLESVAEGAGLGDAVKSGLVDLSVVRSSVWASPAGGSILRVNAQWNDPNVAYQLARSTISEFQDFVATSAASDFTEAETFWESERAKRDLARQAADDELTAFVDALPDLPPGSELPFNDQMQWDRLIAKLDTLEASVAESQANIDEARLAQNQQSSQADRSLTVVDPPEMPGAPESTTMKRLMTLASFVLLGMVIGTAALLVTTVLDQTVASPADVFQVEAVSLVATVPPVRFASEGRRSRVWRRRVGRRSASAAGGT